MSVAIHIDCDGEGCREQWNDAETSEERRLATAYFTSAEDIQELTFTGRSMLVTGRVEFPDGWFVVMGDDIERTRFLCPACV